MNFKKIWETLKSIVDEYSDDKVPKLAAALSYYTVFSVAPLLVIAIAVAGAIFGADAAQGRIVQELKSLVGYEGAQLIQTAIKKTNQTSGGTIATVISIVTLVIAATAAFIELQDSLNIIWKVKPKPGGAFLKEFLRNRVVSFALVVAMGFLLLVSLLISAGLSALEDYLGSILSIPPVILQVANIIISLGVVYILFAMLFKILPDVQVSWKDVRIGALVTTFLFVAGKYLIGLYLGSGTVGSTYGAAGSLAILLVWVYYSAQILFLGAEFTYVYATRFGSGAKPSAHAIPATTMLQEHAKAG
ncbi:YihY/virulence factor BrkB family protein [bacterium]|nr:MAG: YihY/virulence factor BrkB family protein [bacterium]